MLGKMNPDTLLLLGFELTTWIWTIILVLLAIGGFLFLDRLLRKGVYDEDTTGRSDRAGAALSELQTLLNPAHEHVRQEREQKRVERDDSGEPPTN